MLIDASTLVSQAGFWAYRVTTVPQLALLRLWHPTVPQLRRGLSHPRYYSGQTPILFSSPNLHDRFFVNTQTAQIPTPSSSEIVYQEADVDCFANSESCLPFVCLVELPRGFPVTTACHHLSTKTHEAARQRKVDVFSIACRVLARARSSTEKHEK